MVCCEDDVAIFEGKKSVYGEYKLKIFHILYYDKK